MRCFRQATFLRLFIDWQLYEVHCGRMSIATRSASSLETTDPEVYTLIERDRERHTRTLNFIASENYASRAVLECLASHLNVKYAEGYPHNRYYQGVALVDDIEQLAIDRAKQLFGAEHANVQPYSGSKSLLAGGCSSRTLAPDGSVGGVYPSRTIRSKAWARGRSSPGTR